MLRIIEALRTIAILTVETHKQLRHVFDRNHAAVVQSWCRRRGLATSTAVDAAAAGGCQRLLSDKSTHGGASERAGIVNR